MMSPVLEGSVEPQPGLGSLNPAYPRSTAPMSIANVPRDRMCALDVDGTDVEETMATTATEPRGESHVPVASRRVTYCHNGAGLRAFSLIPPLVLTGISRRTLVCVHLPLRLQGFWDLLHNYRPLWQASTS